MKANNCYLIELGSILCFLKTHPPHGILLSLDVTQTSCGPCLGSCQEVDLVPDPHYRKRLRETAEDQC